MCKNLRFGDHFLKSFVFLVLLIFGFLYSGLLYAAVNNVTPTTAVLNQPTTFTVTGSSLTSTLAFFLTDCPSPTLLTGGTATQRQFQCTLSYTGGSKSGTVKDKTGGVVLKSFSV
jgi:hypothetical protein